MTVSPTQRTLAKLRERGCLAAVTERWNQHAKIRQDLFGFVDVLALSRGHTTAIQATTLGNVSHRVNKLLDERAREVEAACLAGWSVRVWGWGDARSEKINQDGTRSKHRVTRLREVAIVCDGPGRLRAMEIGEGDA